MASAASMYVKLQQLTNQANVQEMEFNKQEASVARDWQKMMSDTSHQREVKDLQAAGLNPVLAANQGAQSYTTSSASANVESAAGAVSNAYGAATSAAATRYAANQNYAAALASANATIEAAKWSYKSNKYKVDHTPGSAKAGAINDLINSGISTFKSYIGKGQASNVSKQAQNFVNNSKLFSKYAQSKTPISISQFRSLSKNVIKQLDSQIRQLGVNRITDQVRYDYARFLTTGRESYIKAFKYLT